MGAENYDWTTDDITVEKNNSLSTNPDSYGPRGGCENLNVLLPDDWGRYREVPQCVFQAKSFKYTIYNGRLYLNLSGSNTMYPLINWGFRSNDYISPSPGTDDIVFGSSYFKDVPLHIESNNDPYHPGYLDLPDFRHLLSVDVNGESHDTVSNAAVSNNGRWIVLNFIDIGYVRFDTLDLSAKWIAPHRSSNEFLAISNDGNSLVSVTWGYDSVMAYNLIGCGESAKVLQGNWFNETNAFPCRSRNVSTTINNFLESSTYTSPALPSFNNGSDELTIFVRPDNKDGEGIVLKIVNKKNTTRLDYLSLGDSYSSGEGDTGKDTDGKSFYLPGTDHIGECHVSSRSYPFLLQSALRISSDRMKSVACSGARVTSDYYGDSTTYTGQGDRIKKETQAKQIEIKNNALQNFTPGILKQIDYVKQNKPALITLTGGGNDVGFASILAYCALPSGIGEVSNTCEMALGGTKQRSLLGDAITTQYSKTLELITAIKAASRNTKIYIIGYPSFASEDNNTCLNAAMLNTRERTMINHSVSYLNYVLSQAAKAGGASYVDIEKSLYGGRICEGSSFMTGPLATENQSEMFHPNYLAHEKMAKSILTSGISAEGDNPSPSQNVQSPTKPEFFGNSTYVPTFQDKLIRDGAVYAGKALQLNISPGLFAANELLNFTIWSDETNLGAQTTNAQGELDATFNLPSSIKPGYHLLLAEGKSSSGEPTRVYQFIEVQSSADDADGDGIKNADDKCQYLTVWYDEQSGKNICASVNTPSSNPVNIGKVDISGSAEAKLAMISAVNSGSLQSSRSHESVLGAQDAEGLVKVPTNTNDTNSDQQLAYGAGGILLLLGSLITMRLARKRFVEH